VFPDDANAAVLRARLSNKELDDRYQLKSSLQAWRDKGLSLAECDL
jgi:hypothetical protein